MTTAFPWHSLLAPLPPDARPRRELVAPQLQGTPTGEAIAGWEQLVLELSAGSAGLRILHLMIDAQGNLLSASDLVLYTSLADQSSGLPAPSEQRSIGGRFEPDGRFLGTCWTAKARPIRESAEPEWDLQPSEPTAEEVTALRDLVSELLRRRPGTSA